MPYVKGKYVPSDRTSSVIVRFDCDPAKHALMKQLQTVYGLTMTQTYNLAMLYFLRAYRPILEGMSPHLDCSYLDAGEPDAEARLAFVNDYFRRTLRVQPQAQAPAHSQRQAS